LDGELYKRSTRHARKRILPLPEKYLAHPLGEHRLIAEAIDPSLRSLLQELGVDLLSLKRIVHCGVSGLVGGPEHRLGHLGHLVHLVVVGGDMHCRDTSVSCGCVGCGCMGFLYICTLHIKKLNILVRGACDVSSRRLRATDWGYENFRKLRKTEVQLRRIHFPETV